MSMDCLGIIWGDVGVVSTLYRVSGKFHILSI